MMHADHYGMPCTCRSPSTTALACRRYGRPQTAGTPWAPSPALRCRWTPALAGARCTTAWRSGERPALHSLGLALRLPRLPTPCASRLAGRQGRRGGRGLDRAARGLCGLRQRSGRPGGSLPAPVRASGAEPPHRAAARDRLCPSECYRSLEPHRPRCQAPIVNSRSSRSSRDARGVRPRGAALPLPTLAHACLAPAGRAAALPAPASGAEPQQI